MLDVAAILGLKNTERPSQHGLATGVVYQILRLTFSFPPIIEFVCGRGRLICGVIASLLFSSPSFSLSYIIVSKQHRKRVSEEK